MMAPSVVSAMVTPTMMTTVMLPSMVASMVSILMVAVLMVTSVMNRSIVDLMMSSMMAMMTVMAGELYFLLLKNRIITYVAVMMMAKTVMTVMRHVVLFDLW